MTGSDLASAAAGGILVLVLAVAGVAVGLTLAVVYGAPWLWGLLKPWLHTITG